jgi:hypothetical protein
MSSTSASPTPQADILRTQATEINKQADDIAKMEIANPVSSDGTTITGPGTSIIDMLHRAMSLVHAAVAADGLQVAINGVADTRTRNVVEGYAKAGVFYQKSSSGGWWLLDADGNWPTASDPTGGTIPPVIPPVTSNNFQVTNGKLFYPSGSRFIAHGICITDVTSGMTGIGTIKTAVSNAACQPLLDYFPGTTMVRLAIHTTAAGGLGLEGMNAPELVNAIHWLTAKRIVVQLGNYCFANAPIGADLQEELAWARAIGAAWKDNPYLWISSSNEPSNKSNVGATMAEQAALHDAFRGVGANNQIGLEQVNLYEGDALNGTQIGRFEFVHHSPHVYPSSPPSGGTDVASFKLIAQREVVGPQLLNAPPLRPSPPANPMHSRDGIVPVIWGEYGDSTSGYSDTVEPNGMACVQGVCQAGEEESGWCPWSIYWPQRGLGDKLVWHPDYDLPNTGLTDYGKLIVQMMGSLRPPPS